MAIKDQCETCRKNSSTCEEEVNYNGHSCEQYRKIINLDKEVNNIINIAKEEINPIAENNKIKYPSPNVNPKGWLSFMLFIMALGGLFSAVYPILTYDIKEYDGSFFMAATDVVFGLMLLLLSTYAIFSFVKKKPNAIFVSKMYFIIVLFSHMIILFSGELTDLGIGSLNQTIRSVVWSIIWVLYLSYSNQVLELIPKSYRKVSNIDYYIIAAFIIVPLSCIGLGIGEMSSNIEESENAFIKKLDLAPNEYSDGRIIFTRPDGFICEEQVIEDPQIILYNLEFLDRAYMIVCSHYDDDKSSINFLSYWDNWKDEDLSGYSCNEILNEKRYIGANMYYYKVVEYNTETPILWRFVQYFDSKSNKVSVISYYQFDEQSNYLDDFIKTICF